MTAKEKELVLKAAAFVEKMATRFPSQQEAEIHASDPRHTGQIRAEYTQLSQDAASLVQEIRLYAETKPKRRAR